MSNRIVALYVPETDITSGYFVLADVLTKLPKDVAIVDARTSYSSANLIVRLYSKEFPEVSQSTVPPIAYFKYTPNTGMEITWPTKEYEDIMLKLHNEAIEESVNKDAEVMENEGGMDLATIARIQKAYAEAVAPKVTTGCNHEWFAYGRTAAMKHCKKCGAVSENKVDNS